MSFVVHVSNLMDSISIASRFRRNIHFTCKDQFLSLLLSIEAEKDNQPKNKWTTQRMHQKRVGHIAHMSILNWAIHSDSPSKMRSHSLQSQLRVQKPSLGRNLAWFALWFRWMVPKDVVVCTQRKWLQDLSKAHFAPRPIHTWRINNRSIHLIDPNQS